MSLRQYDWVLIFVVVVLSAIGLSAIYSVDLSRGDTLVYFPTQILALGLGLLVLFVAGSWHVSLYQAAARLVYAASGFLLVAVLFFGTTIRGTTGWFRLGGFSFQPAEFAKLALILFLGWWIHRHGRRFDRWQFVFTSGLSAFILAGLILLQPDAGSAFIIGCIWFGLLLLSGTKKRYIALLLGLLAVGFLIGWLALFKPYQKDRILTFFNPARAPLGAGYSVAQSIIAVGSGQLVGRGLGFGSQSQLHFLPEAQTDFIISVIGEELGFLGVSVVLALYAALLARLSLIAVRCRTDFAAYTVMGVALLFLVHVLVNIGGAVGLLPITGVPLPFLSYGGSALVINFLLIGIVESIVRSIPAPQAFEEG